MYIGKRWLVPAGLSLLLLSALFAGVLLLLGSRFTQMATDVRPAKATSIDPRSTAPRAVVEAAPIADPLAAAVPAVEIAPAAPQPVVTDSQPARTAPEEIVRIATSGSGATQINTRGFGDIGLQLQDVNINGPVTMVHISNQGNNNTTDVNLGSNDRIVSDQRHLQSNRSDGASPPVAVSTGGPRSGAAKPQPTSASGPGGRSQQAVPHQHLRR